MENVRVGVVGLGTMGAGIVEVFARAGYEVVGMDRDEASVERGRGILTSSLGRAVAKGKLSQAQADAALAAVTWSTRLADAAGCALVVEAAFEDLAVKQDIFAALAEAAPDAVLATNTSSLSVTDIARTVPRPERVIGVHFFNPAPVQSLVEVVSTEMTDDATRDVVAGVLERLGKHPIWVGDRAGFVVNALLIPYLNRAISLYEQGLASADEIDEAMVAAGCPMGPLALADMIGQDVNLAIMERMHQATGDGAHEPAPLLRRLVAEGRLGRKNGRGLRAHAPDAEAVTVQTAPQHRADELPLALLAPYLNDACRMVETGYATEADVDTGMAEGCRMPKPFQQLREIGPDVVLAAQERIHAETGFAGHEPSRYLRELA